MDIEAEIGTTEQKDLITKEIEKIICSYLIASNNDDIIEKIIIPIDFDDTIRIISGDDSYTSNRIKINHKAMAKTLWKNKKAILVFSPNLFTGNMDTQVRSIIYFHELCHAIVHPSAVIIDKINSRESELKNIIYHLYEEYFSNRKALEIIDVIFENKSIIYQKHIKNTIKAHYENLTNDKIHYRIIKKGICDFKYYKISFNQVESIILPLFNAFSIDLVFYFSYLDSLNNPAEITNDLEKIKFYNKNTESLIQCFRSKYSDIKINLEDKLNIIEDYLHNFGIKFENTSKGLYCNINFI